MAIIRGAEVISAAETRYIRAGNVGRGCLEPLGRKKPVTRFSSALGDFLMVDGQTARQPPRAVLCVHTTLEREIQAAFAFMGELGPAQRAPVRITRLV